VVSVCCTLSLPVCSNGKSWCPDVNTRDITNQDTPKNAGINKIVSSAPAKLAAGWPAPMINHSAAFKIGYYTKDGLPPDAIVSWLPENSTSDYLVRFDAPCKAGIKVTLCECCNAVSVQIVTNKVAIRFRNSSVWYLLWSKVLLWLLLDMTHRSKSPGGDPVEVSIGAFLPPVTILSQPANGSRHDWTGVTATFPNPPAGAALANGLITVRLRVPKAGVTCELLALPWLSCADT